MFRDSQKNSLIKVGAGIGRRVRHGKHMRYPGRRLRRTAVQQMADAVSLTRHSRLCYCGSKNTGPPRRCGIRQETRKADMGRLVMRP